jgi:hypothetical protein
MDAKSGILAPAVAIGAWWMNRGPDFSGDFRGDLQAAAVRLDKKQPSESRHGSSASRLAFGAGRGGLVNVVTAGFLMDFGGKRCAKWYAKTTKESSNTCESVLFLRRNHWFVRR